jgi:hypothetical protein
VSDGRLVVRVEVMAMSPELASAHEAAEARADAELERRAMEAGIDPARLRELRDTVESRVEAFLITGEDPR